MTKFTVITRRIFLYASLVLCIFSIVMYTTVYITKNRQKIENNHVLLIENHKILLDNQRMLLSNFNTDRDSIYKIILLNDSIIFENMKKLDYNYDYFDFN